MTPLVPINTGAILRIPRIVHLTTTLVCATVVFALTLYSTTAPCRYEGCSMGILLYIPVLCCASLSIVVTLARIVRLIRASSHRTPGAAIRGFVWWTGLGFLVWLGLTIWSGILTWSWDEREGREVGKTCTRHLPEHDDPSGREGNWFAVCIFPDLLWAACLCGLLNYAGKDPAKTPTRHEKGPGSVDGQITTDCADSAAVERHATRSGAAQRNLDSVLTTTTMNRPAWMRTPTSNHSALRVPRLLHMLITLICTSTAFTATLYILIRSYPADILVLLTYVPFLAISLISFLLCVLDYRRDILKQGPCTTWLAWECGLGLLAWIALAASYGLIRPDLFEKDERIGPIGFFSLSQLHNHVLWSACMGAALNYVWGMVLWLMCRRRRKMYHVQDPEACEG